MPRSYRFDVDLDEVEDLDKTSEIKPSLRWDLDLDLDQAEPETIAPAPPASTPLKPTATFNLRAHNARLTVTNTRTGVTIRAAIVTGEDGRRVLVVRDDNIADATSPNAWMAIGEVDDLGIRVDPRDPLACQLAAVIEEPARWCVAGIEVIAELRCRRCNRLLRGDRWLREGRCGPCRDRST